MAAVNGYVTNAALRARGGFDAIPDVTLDDAITAASRIVDQYCGRRFYADDTATARVYRAEQVNLVETHDFYTTTGLVIRTDTGGDGTFETTWTATQYQLEPLNGIVDSVEGFPYSQIVAIGSLGFPRHRVRPLVEVTARWGWAAVPAVVEHVTVDLVRRALFQEQGIQSEQTGSYQVAYDFVGMRQLLSDGHRTLLAPYRKLAVA